MLWWLPFFSALLSFFPSCFEIVKATVCSNQSLFTGVSLSFISPKLNSMKTKLTSFFAFSVCCCLLVPAISRDYPKPPKQGKANPPVNFRSACTTAQAQIDMDINNVRARLLTGGDMWWDRSDGKYVVPKPLTGQPEVSAIFAAGIWLGGFDPGGNLKVACQTYGNNGGNSDYWPGPLSATEGVTDAETCANWDKHFEVKGSDIQVHLALWEAAQNGGQPYTEADIPASVKGWPGRGNPHFSQMHGFDLPDSDQGLAGFFDQDGDGVYRPLSGDFPTLEIVACDVPQFPDQMVFWIYNDEGGGAIHGETYGTPIHMEIQATAFAFSTEDQLNDMTFQRHKFINRAQEDIDSMFIGLWMDADLGCHLDDYIGCDPDRDFAYYYNVDDEDGQPGITCDGVDTYGYNIPALGIDILRGPINEFDQELGMSSFVYHYNSITTGHSGGYDPNTDIEFYRFLSGTWKNGTPLTFGGDGYDPISTNYTKYVYPSAPNDPNGWSMCKPGPEYPNGLTSYDLRTVQSCGSFLLQPGAVNEIVYGVVFAPNINYPCPDLTRLFAADDLAQDYFDNCFNPSAQLAGPDAPDIDWIAGNREITLILTNNGWSNNLEEGFQAPAFGYLRGVTDTTYNFEGYLIYQMAGPNLGFSDIGDTTKARSVLQSDVENGFSTVINWKAEKNPNYQLSPGTEQFLYSPAEMIRGENLGIQRNITIKEDLFAKGSDRRFINHRTYYYLAVAYAANDFLTFDPTTGVGQRQMFLIGLNNIGPDGDGFPYAIVPRPEQNGRLDQVQIVPNPYYNPAAYPDIEGNGYLKITNLPAKCKVTIYTIEGKVVRHFNRNEVPSPPNGSGVEALQIYPDLIWDLKTVAGKDVATGIYLVRINAEGIGELTLKAVVI